MTRVRGLAPWSPQRRTLPLLHAIEQVLEEYSDYWPLTIRQIFYRLVGLDAVDKTEKGYNQVAERLNRARRAGMISFAAIRDDGVIEDSPPYFDGKSGFWDDVKFWADAYRLDRQRDQDAFIEVWVEAGGMVPLVARNVAEFGVPVFSSGGFESLTAKWQAAQRLARREVPTVVLHVGDYDPSGESIFDVIGGDVPLLIADGFPGTPEPEFVRLAVTPAQIDRFDLPTQPPKTKKSGELADKRSVFTDTRTTQAEALPPDRLIEIVRAGVTDRLDDVLFRRLLSLEKRERQDLVTDIAAIRGDRS